MRSTLHDKVAGLLAALAFVGVANYAAGRHRGNVSVAAGREIATVICSACHVVADHQDVQPILQQPTPSFQQIADDPRTTPHALRQFLDTTRWDEKTVPITMPAQGLTDDETGDVIGYILSLRRRR